MQKFNHTSYSLLNKPITTLIVRAVRGYCVAQPTCKFGTVFITHICPWNDTNWANFYDFSDKKLCKRLRDSSENPLPRNWKKLAQAVRTYFWSDQLKCAFRKIGGKLESPYQKNLSKKWAKICCILLEIKFFWNNINWWSTPEWPICPITGRFLLIFGKYFWYCWGNLNMPIYGAKISFFVKTLSL